MRKAWKKKWSLFTAAGILLLGALGLSGCHGSKGLPEFTVPEEFDTTKDYEITFWAKNDTNKTQTEIYKKAISDFEKLYPNITVNLRLYTDYGKIYNDVITNIATGTTPNVCITYPDHIATYMTGSNTVVPLDTLFADPDYGLGGSKLQYDSPALEEIVPDFLKECVLQDHYYAIPFMRSTEACYVNQDYVEALGYELPDTLTWDFIWEVSEAATAKDADGNYVLNGQKTMLPFIYKSTDNMMIQMLKQKNAGYSTADGSIDIFNDTTTEFLYTLADHTKSGAFTTFQISGYPANFLNAGQCVFAVDSTAGSTWMGTDAPLCDISEENLAHFTTKVMTIPQYDPEHPQMISQGPSICVFNKSDNNEVLASWLFAQYLLTNDVQIAYSETEGYVPVTSKAQESPEYQEYLAAAGSDNSLHYDVKLQATRLLLSHLEDTFITPVFNGSASLRSAASQLAESVTKSTKRKETVDDAYLQKLYADTTTLYRLGQASEDTVSGKKELGPLPQTSVILLSVLCIAWLGILLYVVLELHRKKKLRA